MDDSTLRELEDRLYSCPDSLAKDTAQKFLVEVYRLRKELNDPYYTFASGRISRLAILDRNQKISELLEQVKRLKASLSGLEDDDAV
jgi:hypothetical protein